MECVQSINRTLQSLTLGELNEVFDEYDLCNTLVQHLGTIVNKLLEIKTESVMATIHCAKLVEKENLKLMMQTIRAVMQTLHHALELAKGIGLVFDYLFVDSYRYEQVFKLFVGKKQLVKLVTMLVTEH